MALPVGFYGSLQWIGWLSLLDEVALNHWNTQLSEEELNQCNATIKSEEEPFGKNVICKNVHEEWIRKDEENE